MRHIVRVNPRESTPALEKCPECGSTSVELRSDGAYLCKKCFYTTKPAVVGSLLQSWAGSIFSIARGGKAPRKLVLGGRIAILGGALFLAGIALEVAPWSLDGALWRLLAPAAPSSLALWGGVVVVAVLGVFALFAGYTMSKGDTKAWMATLLVGLLGLLLGAIGPGGFLGLVAGGLAVVAAFMGRAD